jgi:hypothetical protein
VPTPVLLKAPDKAAPFIDHVLFKVDELVIGLLNVIKFELLIDTPPFNTNAVVPPKLTDPVVEENVNVVDVDPVPETVAPTVPAKVNVFPLPAGSVIIIAPTVGAVAIIVTV